MNDPKQWTADEYFEYFADWMQHFDKEIIEEARQFYHARLEPGGYGRGNAANAAWNYALGASRFMQKP